MIKYEKIVLIEKISTKSLNKLRKIIRGLHYP